MPENGKDLNSPLPLMQDGEDKSDKELVELTLQDQRYFLYLMRRYAEKLTRYIRRISSASAEDAEDILQEVFVKVYENLNNFDRDLKFSSWVYRITHNQVISNFRKEQARPHLNAQEIDEELMNKLASNLDVAAEVDNAFLKVYIDKILCKLEQKYREVLILKFLEEKDYSEISDILKKPVGTVASLVNRGKKKFKEVMIQNNLHI